MASMLTAHVFVAARSVATSKPRTGLQNDRLYSGRVCFERRTAEGHAPCTCLCAALKSRLAPMQAPGVSSGWVDRARSHATGRLRRSGR